MMVRFTRKSYKRSQNGESLVGLLIATAVGAIVLSATASSFTGSMSALWDRATISEANNHARKVASILASDFRMIGSGMPLGAAKFDMLDVTIGDAPLPILTDSTQTRIRYRLNEYGHFSSLTASFDPSTQTNVSVLSSENFFPGGWVYISNITSEFAQSSTIGGARARISSVGGSTLSLGSIVSGAGVHFNPGSIIEPVSDVTVDCAAAEGITRDSGDGPIILFPNSTCSITFLDSAGSSMAPPLSAATIQSQLTSIRLTVTVPGRRPLRGGNSYSAQVTETVSLRNLILARNP